MWTRSGGLARLWPGSLSQHDLKGPGRAVAAGQAPHFSGKQRGITGLQAGVQVGA